MKILLVKPHTELLVSKRLQEAFLHLEPLELEIVAGGVPAEDTVAILDLGLEKKPLESFQRRITDEHFDMIGFTCYSTQIDIVKKLADIVKQHNRDIVTIVGGVHATLLPKDFSCDAIDAIVRGEGGTTIRTIIKRYKNKEPLYGDGTVLSGNDTNFNDTITGAPPAYPESIEIPLPRRDLVDRSRYFCAWTHTETKKLATMFPRVASLRTSIGCAFSCSFCVIPHLMNGKYVQRTPEDVVEELAALDEEYIYFVDDEMFLNKERIMKIADLLLERGVTKKYISWARSDTIVNHPEIFRLWKKAGLSTLYVGLESMDEKRLKEYKKRAGTDTNKKAVAVLREIGITLHASFIVHPDFDVADFRRLEKDVIDVCPAEVTFTVLSPSPGTTFWHENKERFICDPYTYYDCMHSVLPVRMPIKRFYQHFGRLNHIALRHNPLRLNRIRVPLKDFIRAIIGGTKYIFSLYNIYKDYEDETQVAQ